ncbi:hypothetical protein NEDG_01883 [Nematocida displodere]|uniref:Uncharacterized protein n=1 Tax=Nematocida displodere TaxID=1805483 RepID=A0A177EJE4_9MICR|nr:hypothetical protein NEDG_01883 [Nematocida displodere]
MEVYWRTEYIYTATEISWTRTYLKEAIGLLASVLCTDVGSLPVEQRRCIRMVFNNINDVITERCSGALFQKETAKATGPKDFELICAIAAFNSVFTLINEARTPHRLRYYVPMICEFITADYALPETTKPLVKKLIRLLTEKLSEPQLDGVLASLECLRARGHTLPFFLPSEITEFSETAVEQFIFLQTTRPDLASLFKALHISFAALCAPALGLPNKKSALLTQPQIFLEVIKEALGKQRLKTLEKEKENEITRSVLFYERLALRQTALSPNMPIELLQHCLLWPQNTKDLQKAAMLALSGKTPASLAFPFVAVCLAYFLIDLSPEAPNYSVLLSEGHKTVKLDGFSLLDSLMFFLSRQSNETRKNEQITMLGMFLEIYIAPDTFSVLKTLHQRHKWTLQHSSLVARYISHPTHSADASMFIAGVFVDAELIAPIEEFGLQKEARIIVKALSASRNSTPFTNRLQKQLFSTKTAPHYPLLLINDAVILAAVRSMVKQHAGQDTLLDEITSTLLNTDVIEKRISLIRSAFVQAPPQQKPALFIVVLYFATLLSYDLETLSLITHSLQMPI